MKTVALYARVSTGTQDFELQMKDLNLASKGFKVYKTYQDQITGSSEHREYLDQMIADAKSCKFQELFLWKMDRLARSVRVGLNALDSIEQAGVKISFFKEPYLNTDAPGFKMARNMILIGAEMEHESIKTRVRAAKINFIKSGKWPLPKSPPFGYTCENYQLIINEEQAKVVRRIFKLYNESNLSMRNIVKVFNDEKLPVPSPNHHLRKHFNGWRRDSVKNILDNKIYTGKMMLGKKLGPIAEFQCPPIISEEAFATAIEKKAERFTLTYNPARMRREYLLRGLVRCAKCGFLLFPRIKKQSPNLCVSYQGVSDSTNVKKCFRCGEKSENVLINSIAQGFIGLLGNSNEEQLDKIFGKDKGSGVELGNLEKELVRLKVKRERILECYLASELSAGDKKRRILEVNNETKIIQDKINEINQFEVTKDERDAALKELKWFWSSISRMNRLGKEQGQDPIKFKITPDQSRALVKDLVEKMFIKSIYVDFAKNTLAIHSNLGISTHMALSGSSGNNISRKPSFHEFGIIFNFGVLKNERYV